MADVPPLVLSTIICDRVLLDAPTKTSSLISIRDTIFAPKYPIRYPQIFFFAEMTNGHNVTQISVRLIDTQDNDKVLVERANQVKFPDVKSIVSVVLGFEGLIFNHPGEYHFQLFSAGELLQTRRLLCVLLKKPPTNDQSRQQNPNTWK